MSDKTGMAIKFATLPHFEGKSKCKIESEMGKKKDIEVNKQLSNIETTDMLCTQRIIFQIMPKKKTIFNFGYESECS